MTPPSLRFEILTENLKTMHVDQIIDYRIEVLPKIRRPWKTRISEVIEKEAFVDEQLVGPYNVWHHRHLFEETESGVTMTDTVRFVMPMGVLGDLAYFAFVKRRLKSIFDFRSRFLEERFGASPAQPSGDL